MFVACASLCSGFEGLYTHAYHDTLAHGLPTVCYGETEGVKMTAHYTPVECKLMLSKKLPRYWEEINECINVRISDNEKIAYTDFAYNVGSGGFCHSSLLKKLNAGDHSDACKGLLAWDVASGKHIPGLLRRRVAERDICLRPDARSTTDPVALSIGPQKPHVFPSSLTPTVTVARPPAPKLVCRGIWF